MTDRIDQKFLTPNEVAKRLHVSPITVRQWAQKGLLPAQLTPGGHRRFDPAVVAAFAEQLGGPGKQEEGGVAPRTAGKRRVLVVDDDPQINRLLVSLLKHRGKGRFVVETAQDGFEAGVQVQRFQPDVVLLDLRMPGLDGFEVCRRLKSEPSTASIVVVAMTGYGSEDVRRRIMAAGADQYLTKPFSNDLVLEACSYELPVALEG